MNLTVKSVFSFLFRIDDLSSLLGAASTICDFKSPHLIKADQSSGSEHADAAIL